MKDILLFDGAYGTYYAHRYHDQDLCEKANFTHPERIKRLHEEYIHAGAKAIKTNTFAINEQNFSKNEIKEYINCGYEIANEVANKYQVLVFADIGPISAQKDNSIFEQYQYIVDCFLALHATNFLFETLASEEGIKEITTYIKRKCPNATIITSYAIGVDGFSRNGEYLSRIIEHTRLNKAIDYIGLNCICGPRHMASLLSYFDMKQDRVSVMPNAGYPTVLANQTYYNENSDYFVDEMKQMLQKGVAIVGGCCGTTPIYIDKLNKILNMIDIIEDSDNHETILINKKESNVLKAKLAKQKIIAVEFDPPDNCDISKFMANASRLKQAGVDAITIADCPIARVRVDSSILACKLQREMNMNVIPHMTCRDRNINATKALLYGLAIEGVENVLVVTGDPIPSAQKDEVKAVFNFNSQKMASYIRDLNETLFPKPFMIFAALNINAINFDAELNKAKQKINQGVEAFLTQPVHSKKAIVNLKKAHQELDAYILGGILPIVSYRNAHFMNNEINGMNVDEDIIERYYNKTREEGNALAISISKEFIDAIKDDVDGYYLITPFNRVEIIEAIVEYIKEN